MASYTVKKVGGVCKAFKIEGGAETIICSEGQKVDVGLSSYTVKNEGGVCGIFEVTTRVVDGDIEEKLKKICAEGQTV